tara:strand:+ start:163 stop:1893 length:1731 start_codon:yes stop_codon:yes gene_type:complete
MKKNKILWVVMCLSFFHEGNTQSEPEKPVFEAIMFQEGSKIYVQRDLPIYLSVSTTKDGKGINLETPAHPQDANPMFLDTEGVNYIRSKWAIDKEKQTYHDPKREILFPIYADGNAPKTKIFFKGAPEYIEGQNTFFGKGLQFILPAKESVSGLSKTFFSNNGEYVEYDESKSSLNVEGARKLFFFSVDNVGNTESSRSTSFIIDLTPPETMVEFIGVKFENVVGPSTKFALVSKDNLSGVHATFMSLNEDQELIYETQLSMASLDEGPYKINYYSVDNVENKELPKIEEIFLDKTAPVSTLKVIGDKFEGEYIFVSERTEFNLVATDNKAGVKEIYFSTPSIQEKIFTDNFKLTGSLGLKSINFYAVDRVNNSEKQKSESFFLDNKAPSTSINFGNPSFFTRDTLFISEQSEISLLAKDDDSGPKSSHYRVNDGDTITYEEPFNLKNEGYKRIEFFSTDNVNNLESSKYGAAYVDNSPPEIFINFGLEQIGTEDELAVYPNYVRMFLGATDDKTGTKEILYSINGSDYKAYSSPKTIDLSERGAFSSSKKYEVKVIARDMVGNETNKTLSFLVKG